MKKKITILGSCSGTEPMIGRHHTSWALEVGEKLYFFDAGEGCAHTAYLSGLDLLSLRALFISHPHLDHVGGIPHLLWTLGKLEYVQHAPWQFKKEFRLFTPDCEQMNHLAAALLSTEFPDVAGSFRPQPVTDGILYQDELITVEAHHNMHMGIPADGIWQSYSYKITAPDATIVYSGDVGSLDELGTWPAEADLFLMETGHHDPEAVVQDLVKANCRFPEVLVFVHHGRKILYHPDEVGKACAARYPGKVFIADDGMSLAWESTEEESTAKEESPLSIKNI